MCINYVYTEGDNWEVDDIKITAVAEKFVFANCYNPQVAAKWFENFSS